MFVTHMSTHIHLPKLPPLSKIFILELEKENTKAYLPGTANV